MYRGVNLDGINISSYETALATLEQREKKGLRTKHNDWSLGHPKAGVTGIRRLGLSDSIALRLYGTDVVVWNPDNSFEVDNYGTATTSAFAAAVLPAGIHLSYDVKRRGVDCENRAITYHPAFRDGDWEAYWAGARVVNGEDRVTFYPVEDGSWAPKEDEVTPFEFFETDVRRARELSREYHLRDFQTYLEVALPHFYEKPVWQGDEPGTARWMLRERNFAGAACYLPPVEDSGAFGNKLKPYAIRASGRGPGWRITPASLARFKALLYDDEGASIRTSVRLPTLKEYQRITKRMKALERAGVYL